MDSIAGVSFLQGDFHQDAVIDALSEKNQSDMASNMAGNLSVDQPGAIYLVEPALDMYRQALAANGSFEVKVFLMEGFDQYVKDVRDLFKVVNIIKPDSS